MALAIYKDVDSDSETDSDNEARVDMNYYHVLNKEGDNENSIPELQVDDQHTVSNDCLYALPDLPAKSNRSSKK